MNKILHTAKNIISLFARNFSIEICIQNWKNKFAVGQCYCYGKSENLLQAPHFEDSYLFVIWDPETKQVKQESLTNIVEKREFVGNSIICWVPLLIARKQQILRRTGKHSCCLRVKNFLTGFQKKSCPGIYGEVHQPRKNMKHFLANTLLLPRAGRYYSVNLRSYQTKSFSFKWQKCSWILKKCLPLNCSNENGC